MSSYGEGPGWWQASDGKWYPPQAAPAYQTYPGPPPVAPRNNNGCLIAGAVVAAVMILGGVACVALVGEAAEDVSESIDEDQEQRERVFAEDVTLDGCNPTEFGNMAAQVTVTNHSSDRSNYSIKVSFTSPDKAELYDSTFTYVSGLEEGQTTTDEVTSIEDAPAEYVCEIVDITRLSDE